MYELDSKIIQIIPANNVVGIFTDGKGKQGDLCLGIICWALV